ncbi:hypothetical protein [Pedobacter montanisoli]|uniref:Uncharacterized protein n=1 Tax=Pedobacter montanisoli TaxID=2923277 RepID=A0ABS9ZZC6_9SPHI|nr:hypothetical protein [Pedobacter montanisoli]MCJ0743671.1 hypothetical protein [Pedobacter montanisoli]
MRVFRFKRIKTGAYTAYTVIAVILSIFIFTGLNMYINKPIAYLLVSIMSLISILLAVKKAGKEFEEIVIFEDDKLKFYFQNRMREPLIISKSEISLTILEDEVEFKTSNTDKFIGKAYKVNLEADYSWEDFIQGIS